MVHFAYGVFTSALYKSGANLQKKKEKGAQKKDLTQKMSFLPIFFITLHPQLNLKR